MLTKILVHHDNTGVGASWFLEQVEVTEGPEGGRDQRTVRFPCGRWLEECDGCGGELEAELTPEGSPGRRREVKGKCMERPGVGEGGSFQ